MLNRSLLGIAAGALLFCSPASQAQDTSFYLHGSLGQASIEETSFLVYEDDTDTSLGIKFGWRLRPWLAVEAGYNDFGNYQAVCPPTGQTPGCLATVFPERDFNSFELGLAFRVPFGDSGLYGAARAGVHHWDVGNGVSATDPHYGVGLGYRFTERLGVSLDYDNYQTDNAILDIDQTSVGVEFDF